VKFVFSPLYLLTLYSR